MGQIFFASLRLGVFALKSACLIEWIRLRPLLVDDFALTGVPISLITPVMDDRNLNVFTREIRGLRAAGAKDMLLLRPLRSEFAGANLIQRV
jgi:hypothetical protein